MHVNKYDVNLKLVGLSVYVRLIIVDASKTFLIHPLSLYTELVNRQSLFGH